MNPLIEKIRKSRVITIEVGAMKFIARRPTPEEVGGMIRDALTDTNIARRYVTGWENVRECDLFIGGEQTLIEFDAELWNEAIGDLPNIWKEIVNRLMNAHLEYSQSRAELAKN